jgi:hypothetical protein
VDKQDHRGTPKPRRGMRHALEVGWCKNRKVRGTKQSQLDMGRSAKGSERPIYEVAPLLVSAHGSKRVNPRRKRSERVVILLTHGDPRVAAASSPLASRDGFSRRRRPPRRPPPARVGRGTPGGGAPPRRSPPEHVLAVSSLALEPFFSPPGGRTVLAVAGA